MTYREWITEQKRDLDRRIGELPAWLRRAPGFLQLDTRSLRIVKKSRKLAATSSSRGRTTAAKKRW